MNSMLHTYVLLAMAAGSAVLKDRFHVDTSHVATFHGLLAIALGLVWHSTIVQHKLGEIKAKLEALLPKAACLVLALGMMGGCAATASMSDADFAGWVKSQAETDVSASLTLASTVDAAKAAEIKADALAAKAILDGPVAQLFSGAGAGTVTVASVNAALPLFKAKLAGLKNGPAIAAAVQLAMGQVLAQLQLPGLPSATLSTRTAQAAAGLFAGASKGISDFAGGP